MNTDVDCYYQKEESYVGEQIETTINILNNGGIRAESRCKRLEEIENGVGDFEFSITYGHFNEFHKDMNDVTDFIKRQIKVYKSFPETILAENGFTFHSVQDVDMNKKNRFKLIPYMDDSIRTSVFLDMDNGHIVESISINNPSFKSVIKDICLGELEDKINDSISHVQADIHRNCTKTEEVHNPLPVED